MFSFLRVSSSLGLLRTYYVASHNLELLILPSPPPTCWNHMCAQLNLVNLVHFKIWLQICYPSRKYMLRRHSESCQLTLLLVSKKRAASKAHWTQKRFQGAELSARPQTPRSDYLRVGFARCLVPGPGGFENIGIIKSPRMAERLCLSLALFVLPTESVELFKLTKDNGNLVCQ